MNEIATVRNQAAALQPLSPQSLSDQSLLDSYRTITNIEKASWVAKCQIAAEIYHRIRAAISVRLKKKEIEAQDKEVKNQLEAVCKSLNVSYQTFMYDKRIYDLFFNPDADIVSGIESTEMYRAAEVLSRACYAEASVATDPRAVVSFLMNEWTEGRPATSETARAYVSSLKKGERKPSGTIIATIRAGALPPAIEEHIIDVLNGTAYVLEGRGEYLLKVGPTIKMAEEGIQIAS